jgi:hypothetical protein
MARSPEQIIKEQIGEMSFANAILASQLEAANEQLIAAQRALEELGKEK